VKRYGMDYRTEDDRRFGYRVVLTAVAASLPVWIGVLLAGFWLRSLLACLIALLVTLPLALATIPWKTWSASCPECRRRIKVDWKNEEYRRGGMLRYRCDDCRIVWRTFLFPGSDV
jgi:hypothetical protein